MLYKNTHLKIITLTGTLFVSSTLLMSPFSWAANSPVKSVDAAGNVTYSDKPIPEAKKTSRVSIQPGPSSNEIDAAQQQAEKNISTAKDIDKKNAAEQRPANKAPKRQSSNDTVTSSGTSIQPFYGKKPHHKPIHNKPGINPPKPQHPIARPGAGGGMR